MWCKPILFPPVCYFKDFQWSMVKNTLKFFKKVNPRIRLFEEFQWIMTYHKRTQIMYYASSVATWYGQKRGEKREGDW